VSDLRELLRGLEVFSGGSPAFDTSQAPADPHRPFLGRPAAARAIRPGDGCPGTGRERGLTWA
jgi:hypothetical protein